MNNILKIKKLVLSGLAITISIWCKIPPQYFNPSDQELIEEEVNPNQGLLEAVIDGNALEAQHFISIGANVNTVVVDHYPFCSLLHIAVEYGNLEMVEYLIDAGAAVNVKDIEGLTPLHYAVKNEHLEIVEVLINANTQDTADTQNTQGIQGAQNTQSYNINITDKYGRTPLYHAIENDNFEIVQYLISVGADVNQADKYSIAPINLAIATLEIALYGPEILRLLISAGADLNHVSHYETPLYCATHYNDMSAVHMLLKAGVNANISNPDKNNETPLYIANFDNNTEIVELLKSAGADTGEYKNKPTDLARAIMLGDIDFVKDAIQNDPAVINNPCDYEGCTPLQLAVFWRQEDVANILKDSGATIARDRTIT